MSSHIPVPIERWTELVQAHAEASQLRSTVQDLALRIKTLEVAGDAMASMITKAAQEAAKENGEHSGYLIRCVQAWKRAKEGPFK